MRERDGAESAPPVPATSSTSAAQAEVVTEEDSWWEAIKEAPGRAVAYVGEKLDETQEGVEAWFKKKWIGDRPPDEDKAKLAEIVENMSGFREGQGQIVSRDLTPVQESLAEHAGYTAKKGMEQYGAPAAGAVVGRASRVLKKLDFSDELAVSAKRARARLRVATPGTGGQVHHILPWQLRHHEVAQRAARGGFNINGAENGVRLGGQHIGSHPRYSQAVQTRLDAILEATPNISEAEAASQVRSYVGRLRQGIERSNAKLR